MYESKAFAALVGLVTGALQRLSREQPIVSEVSAPQAVGTREACIYVTFNGDERYVVKVERA